MTMTDETRVLNIIHRAEMTFDEGDFDAHMGLWAEVHFDSPFGKAASEEEYLGFMRGFYEQVKSAGGTRHFVLNPVVTIDGDAAEVHAYLHIVNRSDGSFMGTSVIHDRLRRDEGGWRFVSRSVMPDQDLSQLVK